MRCYVWSKSSQIDTVLSAIYIFRNFQLMLWINYCMKLKIYVATKLILVGNTARKPNNLCKIYWSAQFYRELTWGGYMLVDHRIWLWLILKWYHILSCTWTRKQIIFFNEDGNWHVWYLKKDFKSLYSDFYYM